MAGAADDALVTLSVRGREYRELRSTLTAHDGPLAAIARGDIGVATDGDGSPYVDCDPDLFHYVLNFLRLRRAFLPSGFDRWEELRAYFDYFTFPFPDDAKAAEEAALKAKRKRDRVPSIVVLTIEDYGHHDLVFDRTRNLVKPNLSGRLPADISDSLREFAADAGFQNLKLSGTCISEVTAITKSGHYRLRHVMNEDESYLADDWVKIGTWLDNVESVDVRVRKTGGARKGFWEIDGNAVPTPAAAISHLSARGYQRTSSTTQGSTTVLTYSKHA